MNPSTDLRLASMMRAVSDVILPAVAGNSFATEQAMLLLGHLHVLRTQADHAPRYEYLTLLSTKKLAHKLAEQAEGGSQTVAAAQALATVAKQDVTDPKSVRQLCDTINAAIEMLTLATAEDGTEAYHQTAMQSVISHGTETAMQERSWFSGMGFEGGGSSVESIDAMLDKLEASTTA